MSAGGVLAGGVAQAESGARSEGVAIADSRDRDGATALWVQSNSHVAAARGLAREKRARVPARRVPIADTRPALEPALHRGPAPLTTGVQQCWSIDFMHDQLFDGWPFRVLTVVDQWSRQSQVLECGLSLTGRSVVAALERARVMHGLPVSITIDQGTEFISKALETWAFYRWVQLDFTRPSKPTGNGHIQSFNGRLRDECLNVHQYLSLDHAAQLLETWLTDYNQHRPHSSLGHLTPNEIAISGHVHGPEKTATFQF